jgi:transcriptional regulator with XRE-family HTH domain
MTFGRKLKTLRVTKGLTQQEMADYLGISRTSYIAYERDKWKPASIEKYRKIADVLGCNLSYLTDKDEQELNKRPYEVDITPEQLRLVYSYETAGRILAFVDNYGSDNEVFAKIIAASHPTLQQSVMRLFIKTIEEISKQPSDPKNEQAVELAKKITEVAKDYTLPLI